MSSRLRSIQWLWLLIIAVSLTLAGLSAYAERDGAMHIVVKELRRFRDTFDSTVVSKALSDAARAQGQVPVSNIAANIAGPGVPAMQFAPAAIVLPRGEVQVTTLGDAKKYQAAQTATIGVLDAQALGKALAFRLAHAAETGPLLLQSVELLPTALSEADAQLLLDAEDARLASLSTRKTLDAAQAEQERLETLYEQRAKWRAPVKVLEKTHEQRAEARQAYSKAQIAWEVASGKYKKTADAAVALNVDGNRDGAFSMAIATVTFARVEGKPLLTLKIPTKLKESAVPLPPLSGIDFAHTERTGLWPAVADLTPTAALARAEQEFTFFSKGIAIGKFQITGAATLQLGALFLPLLLWLLVARSRTAAKGYDPFARQEALPQVGFRSDALNLCTTAFLPALAAVFGSYVLWRLGQWPVVSAPSALAAALLGVGAKDKLHDLRELKAAVIRTSSAPPGMPMSITPLPPRSELPIPPKDRT